MSKRHMKGKGMQKQLRKSSILHVKKKKHERTLRSQKSQRKFLYRLRKQNDRAKRKLKFRKRKDVGDTKVPAYSGYRTTTPALKRSPLKPKPLSDKDR